MAKQYYLVTGTGAAEVERLTGLRGDDTLHGVLVEKPKPFNLDREMERINRALNPTRCTCGPWAIFHQPRCPMYNLIT